MHVSLEGGIAVFHAERVDDVLEACLRIADDAAIAGAVVAPRIAEFATIIASGDLGGDAARLFEIACRWNGALRAAERTGKPLAAALGTSALGLPFSAALATHYRVAANGPGVRFGFPDVRYGLVPAGGATQRVPRLAGLPSALPLLLEGTMLDAGDAVRAGLVQAACAPGDEVATARTWVERALHDPSAAAQPWDARGFRVPGGDPKGAAGAQTFMVANAMVRQRTYGNEPAVIDTLACVYEGLQTDVDTGLRIEARAFVHAARTPAAVQLWRLASYRGDGATAPDMREIALAYANEGLALAAQGRARSVIEHAGRIAGMACGPLEMARTLGLNGAGARADRVDAPNDAGIDDVVERLLAIQCVAAAKLAEATGAPAIAIDAAAVRDAGFPAFRGGPLAAIAAEGPAHFTARARALAERYGPRFLPPASLRA